MNVITVGIDLAKNVFAVHGVDETGKSVLVKPKVARGNLLDLIMQLPPCVIGMEACSGAHHWARLFRQYGHTVKLMVPKFVTLYRMSGKRGKNDATDAAAKVAVRFADRILRRKVGVLVVSENIAQHVLDYRDGISLTDISCFCGDENGLIPLDSGDQALGDFFRNRCHVLPPGNVSAGLNL